MRLHRGGAASGTTLARPGGASAPLRAPQLRVPCRGTGAECDRSAARRPVPAQIRPTRRPAAAGAGADVTTLGPVPSPLPVDPVREAHRHWTGHGWAQAADGMAAVTSLMRAQQIVLARVDAVLRPLGVTFARYEVLMLLHFSRRGSLPMTVIGARLQVHPTSVTNAVDRLEQAGLVERTPHPSDRRTTLVVLRPAGRDLALRATADLNEQVFEAMGGLDPGDLRRLVDVLAELRREEGDFRE